MNEWRRIVSDRRRLVLMLCLPFICFAFFFYQKTMDTTPADSQEYRALVERWRGHAPQDILAALSEQVRLSENEVRFQAQAEYLLDYPNYLERVQEQAYKMQHSAIFGADPDSFVYRNILKTASDFAELSGNDVRLGDDLAIQNWLAFPLADWCFLAAVVLLVMAFLEERKKGLAAIIRSCPAGRVKLQCTRLLILLLYCVAMAFLTSYLPLAVSLLAEGGWNDLSRPVQSLPAFQKCTARLTVGGFLAQSFCLKTACGFFLGALLWFVLSFLEQVQLCWMATAAVLAAEYLLYTVVPAQSVLSSLRYVNIFSYVFSSKLYTEYVNLNFFSYPVGKSTVLLGLLLLGTGTLTILITALLPKRYPFGNRNLLGKWIPVCNRIKDALLRRLGVVGFEWYKLFFLTVGGMILLLGLPVSRDLPLNSGAYNRIEDAVYRQYVAQVQGPVTQDTHEYIAQAKAALEGLEINRAEFEAALNRLEQTVADTPESAWLVDDTMFLNIYGRESWYTQRNAAWIALLILCGGLSPLFSPEQNADLRRILRSTPGGRQKLFLAKYSVAFGVTVLVWLMVFVRQWYTASKMLGRTVLSAPCASIDTIQSFPGTVQSYLAVFCILQGIALLLSTNLCVFFGEKARGFEKAFLMNLVFLLIPAAAYRFGVHGLRFVTPISFLADGNVLLSDVNHVLLFGIWIAGTIAALVAAKWDWISEDRKRARRIP